MFNSLDISFFGESALEEGQEKTSKLDIVKVRRQNKGGKIPEKIEENIKQYKGFMDSCDRSIKRRYTIKSTLLLNICLLELTVQIIRFHRLQSIVIALTNISR